MARSISMFVFPSQIFCQHQITKPSSDSTLSHAEQPHFGWLMTGSHITGVGSWGVHKRRFHYKDVDLNRYDLSVCIFPFLDRQGETMLTSVHFVEYCLLNGHSSSVISFQPMPCTPLTFGWWRYRSITPGPTASWTTPSVPWLARSSVSTTASERWGVYTGPGGLGGCMSFILKTPWGGEKVMVKVKVWGFKVTLWSEVRFNQNW